MWPAAVTPRAGHEWARPRCARAAARPRAWRHRARSLARAAVAPLAAGAWCAAGAGMRSVMSAFDLQAPGNACSSPGGRKHACCAAAGPGGAVAHCLNRAGPGVPAAGAARGGAAEEHIAAQGRGAEAQRARKAGAEPWVPGAPRQRNWRQRERPPNRALLVGGASGCRAQAGHRARGRRSTPAPGAPRACAGGRGRTRARFSASGAIVAHPSPSLL